ncbi:HSFA6b [Ecytonucleospora hepatopenaei]|uniref:HSFA6b n=1 Tax=Ecytonucleospora hepatopenaei TaxID=646526 RepID=A0A1W0E549_9MICR|nr:HSFA6b [Ecytonucleospora hepatopenaei]
MFSKNNFIEKLHDICSRDELSEIIAWCKKGTCFAIYDVQSFSKTILCEISKSNNFKSFIRQLNRYNFTRLKSEEVDVYIFHNKWFVKNKKELISNICRKNVKTKTFTREFEISSSLNETLKTGLFNKYAIKTLETIINDNNQLLIEFEKIFMYMKELKEEIKIKNKKYFFMIFSQNEKTLQHFSVIFKQIGYSLLIASDEVTLVNLIRKNYFEIIFLSDYDFLSKYFDNCIDDVKYTSIVLITNKSTETYEYFNKYKHEYFNKYKNICGIIESNCKYEEVEQIIYNTLKSKKHNDF